MEKKEKRKGSDRNYGVVGTVYDVVSILVTSITLLALVFSFGVRMVGVDGPSMNNTLFTDDWLLVTPYYGSPHYGDIVICTKDTVAEGAIVKRVIALEGDEVVINENDEVFVNGVKLDEPYALPGSYTSRSDAISYPVIVPEGCVMLLGDNRRVSLDSRYRGIGFIEKEHLLGKAQFRMSKDYDIYYNFNTEN